MISIQAKMPNIVRIYNEVNVTSKIIVINNLFNASKIHLKIVYYYAKDILLSTVR